MVILSRVRGAGRPLLLAVVAASACRGPASEPKAIRLIDAFDTKLVEGSPGSAAAAGPVRRTEWRFDGPAPSPPPAPAPPARPSPPPFAPRAGGKRGPG
jgi:hypothetical protein